MVVIITLSRREEESGRVTGSAVGYGSVTQTLVNNKRPHDCGHSHNAAFGHSFSVIGRLAVLSPSYGGTSTSNLPVLSVDLHRGFIIISPSSSLIFFLPPVPTAESTSTSTLEKSIVSPNGDDALI